MEYKNNFPYCIGCFEEKDHTLTCKNITLNEKGEKVICGMKYCVECFLDTFINDQTEHIMCMSCKQPIKKSLIKELLGNKYSEYKRCILKKLVVSHSKELNLIDIGIEGFKIWKEKKISDTITYAQRHPGADLTQNEIEELKSLNVPKEIYLSLSHAITRANVIIDNMREIENKYWNKFEELETPKDIDGNEKALEALYKHYDTHCNHFLNTVGKSFLKNIKNEKLSVIRLMFEHINSIDYVHDKEEAIDMNDIIVGICKCEGSITSKEHKCNRCGNIYCSKCNEPLINHKMITLNDYFDVKSYTAPPTKAKNKEQAKDNKKLKEEYDKNIENCHLMEGKSDKEKFEFLRHCMANYQSFVVDKTLFNVNMYLDAIKQPRIKTERIEEQEFVIYECNREAYESVKEMKKDGGMYCPNPSCRTWIQKINGCNQMFCTICKTSFDYQSGRKLDTRALGHNPHLDDYNKSMSKLTLETLGNIKCDVLSDEFTKMVELVGKAMAPGGEVDSDIDFCRKLYLKINEMREFITNHIISNIEHKYHDIELEHKLAIMKDFDFDMDRCGDMEQYNYDITIKNEKFGNKLWEIYDEIESLNEIEPLYQTYIQVATYELTLIQAFLIKHCKNVKNIKMDDKIYEMLVAKINSMKRFLKVIYDEIDYTVRVLEYPNYVDMYELNVSAPAITEKESALLNEMHNEFIVFDKDENKKLDSSLFNM